MLLSPYQRIRIQILDCWWSLRKAWFTDRETVLRKALRSAPWWRLGHHELALIALGTQNFDLAYGSAQACLQLARSNTEQIQARSILAKCFLGTFEFERAIKTLEQMAGPLMHVEAKEDLAAAYIGMRRWKEASQILHEISERNISSAGIAALEYCERKLSE